MGYVEELRALIGHRRIVLNGSAVIVQDAQDRILLQQRVYPRGRWGLPGGLMELGESTEETARREALEETGLALGRLNLLGIYSGEGYLCSAPNGDEWYVVTTTFWTREFSGTAAVSDHESLALAWFTPDELPGDVAGTHRVMLRDYARRGKEGSPCQTIM